MASGNVNVTVGYDKKSLKEMRRFVKELQKCYGMIVDIKQRMEELKLKRTGDDC